MTHSDCFIVGHYNKTINYNYQICQEKCQGNNLLQKHSCIRCMKPYLYRQWNISYSINNTDLYKIINQDISYFVEFSKIFNYSSDKFAGAVKKFDDYPIEILGKKYCYVDKSGNLFFFEIDKFSYCLYFIMNMCLLLPMIFFLNDYPDFGYLEKEKRM